MVLVSHRVGSGLICMCNLATRVHIVAVCTIYDRIRHSRLKNMGQNQGDGTPASGLLGPVQRLFSGGFASY
jgi:hypothetical protein